MSDTLNRLMTRGMCVALTAVGLALAAAPAYAQTVDEITVMGWSDPLCPPSAPMRQIQGSC